MEAAEKAERADQDPSDLAAEAAEQLREQAQHATEALAGAARDLQDQVEPVLTSIDETTRRLVEEHPLATLVGAAAAGYLVGRLLTRR